MLYMFFASENVNFPIDVLLFVHICSKPLLGTVFRGPPGRSLLEDWMLGAIDDFGWFSKRYLLDNLFVQTPTNNTDRFILDRFLPRACFS